MRVADVLRDLDRVPVALEARPEHVPGEPEAESSKSLSKPVSVHFLSIASRLALNSFPGFHSGNLSACATR